MNEWVNDWKNELINEWLNEWMNLWVNEWKNQRTNIWKSYNYKVDIAFLLLCLEILPDKPIKPTNGQTYNHSGYHSWFNLSVRQNQSLLEMQGRILIRWPLRNDDFIGADDISFRNFGPVTFPTAVPVWTDTALGQNRAEYGFQIEETNLWGRKNDDDDDDDDNGSYSCFRSTPDLDGKTFPIST